MDIKNILWYILWLFDMYKPNATQRKQQKYNYENTCCVCSMPPNLVSKSDIFY